MTPEGLWQTNVDDKTGEAKARSHQGQPGRADRRHRKAPATPSPRTCARNASDDRKCSKPILGLEIIRGARKADGRTYGRAARSLDPKTAATTRCASRPSRGGKSWKCAAPLPFGRTQPGCGMQWRPPSVKGGMNQCPDFNKVAVLGAWRDMGAQIAATWSTSRCRWCCSTCRPKEGPRTASSPRRSATSRSSSPALGVAEDAALISQANYEEHLEQLLRCDLIIEAIARAHGLEAGSLQEDRPLRGAQTIVASTPRACRSPSCPGAARCHQAALLRHPLLQPAALHGAGGADQHPPPGAPRSTLEAFVTSTLGKGVVRAVATSSPTAWASPACWRP